MVRKGFKQTLEHTNKIVLSRRNNNSYINNSFKEGHKFCGKISTKTQFKKGMIPHNKGKRIKLDLELIKREHFDKEKSIKDISKELGISDRLIRIRLKEAGIEIRKKEMVTNLTKEKIKKARANQITPTKDTKIEIKIQNFLKDLGITFLTHQYMKDIVHGYQCDILIPSLNLVIECDGNYWHKYPTGNEIDHVRTSELINKGFKVLRLWEVDIKQMNIENFKELI